MAYKIKIDELKTYPIKDGFVLKDEYNETLDSGTIQFTTFCEEIDASSFDSLEVFDTENKILKKSYLIDSGDDEVFCFRSNNENDHTYTLMLFSQTKELERITLPNCSVTQPIISGVEKKSVWDEIQRFCSLYFPKIRVYDAEERFTTVCKYKIDSSVKAKFENVICPEFQWNNPTLREVLNDLMSTLDCIAVLNNNFLTYYDLTERGNKIDVSKLSYSKKSFGSNDYIGELTIAMKNGVSSSKSIVCEKKSLRVTGAMFNTNDACFITHHPIYNIVSCKVSFYYTYKDGGGDEGAVWTRYFKNVDITRFIVEDDEYSVASSARYNGNDINTALGHKQYLLNYKRGGNTIEGWGRLTRVYPSNNQAPTIGWIARILGLFSDGYDTLYPNNGFASLGWGHHGEIIGIHLDVEYETLSEHAMHVGHYLPVKHPENRVFDNQTNSYVDVNHQSIFEYAKANRLGNKIIEIHGTYFKESDIPQLSDKIGENILFSREVKYSDCQFDFKGYLLPNYVLKNYFTGVQAKRRSWQLAKDNEALGRNEILKEYLEFSFKRKLDIIDANYLFEITKFADSISGHSSEESIKYVLLRSIDSDGVAYPSSTHVYQLDLDASIQGMSVCFNFGTMDNVSVDYYLTYDSDEDAYYNNLYKYCDENGEFDSARIILSNNINPSDGEFEWDYGGDTYYSNSQSDCNWIMGKIFDKVTKKPIIKLSPVTKNADFIISNFKKDNREIIMFSMQFEYCSDTPDIIVTQKFIELCSSLNDSLLSSSSLKIYSSSNQKYGLNDKTGKGEIIVNSCYSTLEYRSVKIGLNQEISNSVSWGVCDSDGNLLLGVNGINGKPVYLNVLSSRDTNIYYSQEDHYILGDLTTNHQTLTQRYNEHTANSNNYRRPVRSSRENLTLLDVTKDVPNESELNSITVSDAYDIE